MSQNIIAVNFNNQSLFATLIDNVPYVAVKPICESLGIDWEAQRQKINRHPILKEGACMIKAPSNGGIQEMLMLPIRMLNGWLFGIDSSRVKVEAKEAVLKYQRECFDVLANHFMPKPNALRDLPKKENTENWNVLYELYGSQITNRWGYLIPETWSMELDKLTQAQFDNGVQGCIKSKSPFMPTLPVFVAYCHDHEIVKAMPKSLSGKEKIAMSCESRADILNHVEYNQSRINAFEDLLNGMKRSNEAFKGVLKA